MIEEGCLYMKLIDGDEQDNKNNQKNIWGKQEENVCTEKISVNHVIHPLKRSQNLRPIDDEEWESMLRILKSHKHV